MRITNIYKRLRRDAYLSNMDLAAIIEIMPEDVRISAFATLVGAALDDEFPLSPVSPSALIGKWMKVYVTPAECPMLTLIYLRNLRASDADLTKKDNFNALTLCAAFMVAFKFSFASKGTSKRFAEFFELSFSDINRCERLFLTAHHWNMYIHEHVWDVRCEQLVKDKTLTISEEYLTQLWERIVQTEDKETRELAVQHFCEQVHLRTQNKKRKREVIDAIDALD